MVVTYLFWIGRVFSILDDCKIVYRLGSGQGSFFSQQGIGLLCAHAIFVNRDQLMISSAGLQATYVLPLLLPDGFRSLHMSIQDLRNISFSVKDDVYGPIREG